MADAGLVNHITELDISASNDPGSCYTDRTGCVPALTDAELPEFLTEQVELCRAVFQTARDDGNVGAVLTWGLHDGQSWLNHFPVQRE